MSEEKKRKRVRSYLTGLRFLVAFACFLFTVSVFCPFLQTYVPLIQFGPEYYWSCKGTVVYAGPTNGFVAQVYWFESYWTGPRMLYKGLWTQNALRLMLGAQVLTVLFGALSSIKLSPAYKRASWTPNPYLLLASTALTVVAMSCMWFVYNAFGSLYVKQFEAGFWLSLLSVTLFFAAFLLSLKRPQKAKPTTVEDIAAYTKK